MIVRIGKAPRAFIILSLYKQFLPNTRVRFFQRKEGLNKKYEANSPKILFHIKKQSATDQSRSNLSLALETARYLQGFCEPPKPTSILTKFDL